MKLNDAVWGAIFLALALAVLWNIQGFPKIHGQQVGPAAFPGLLAVLLGGCALALMVRGLRHRGEQPWVLLQAWTRSSRQLVAFAVAVGGLLLYILAADRLGFLVCGSVFLLALMLALRVRLATALIVAPLAALFIHLVFYKVLRVPLPWGVLPVLY